ncbi:hypothetical protein DMB44_02940 [Thermoplasma sp. Kam2015]|nr:hypothetical protein DMB44_02940 [Thermoplasma sp. Kam2015]
MHANKKLMAEKKIRRFSLVAASRSILDQAVSPIIATCRHGGIFLHRNSFIIFFVSLRDG